MISPTGECAVWVSTETRVPKELVIQAALILNTIKTTRLDVPQCGCVEGINTRGSVVGRANKSLSKLRYTKPKGTGCIVRVGESPSDHALQDSKLDPSFICMLPRERKPNFAADSFYIMCRQK